ncbi:MAG: hypothetical protein AAFR54_18045, partial [Planctomycetota bacterium]
AAVANFGTSDAMYAANADTPYFSAIETGEQYQDSGIIPGSTNTLVTGGRDDNFVTSFDFAYCEFDPSLATTSFEIDFHESVVPCTTLVGAVPTASFVVDQLPASGQCWVVNVDLTGGGEFCIGGDGGDGVYDADDTLDSFGFAIRYTGGGINPATGTSGFGPILGADPAATDSVYSNPNGPPLIGAGGTPLNPPAPPSVEGTGTYYNPLSGCTSAFTPTGVAKETGSGLRNQDVWFIEDLAGSGANSACFYFLGYFNLAGACGAGQGQPLTGNNPFSAFYMEMNGTDSCQTSDVISSPTACAPTPNTSGVPGVCEVSGDAIATNNDVVLRARELPTSPTGVFGIFLHGLSDISATPVSVGQGVLCIGGTGRFQAMNQIQQAGPNGIAEISTAAGNLSLSTLPISTAPFAVAASSGLTSYFAFWHRDFVTPAAAAFNFTGSCSVVWQ